MRTPSEKRGTVPAHAMCAGLLLVLFIPAAILFSACRDVPSYDIAPAKDDSMKEKMIGANRVIAQSEEQQIDAYLTRRGWPTAKLPNGVWVAEHGENGAAHGQAIGYEDTVVIHYRVETLGGDEVYGWRADTVVCGRLKPTRGLDAALRTLHRGSSATVIVPSEQGYGLVGDGDRIRTRMVLVYEVNIEGNKTKNNKQ